MNTIELTQTSNAGDRNPLNQRYTANGKRVSREEFDDIKRRAIRLECFSNASVNGRETFYCTARVV